MSCEEHNSLHRLFHEDNLLRHWKDGSLNAPDLGCLALAGRLSIQFLLTALAAYFAVIAGADCPMWSFSIMTISSIMVHSRWRGYCKSLNKPFWNYLNCHEEAVGQRAAYRSPISNFWFFKWFISLLVVIRHKYNSSWLQDDIALLIHEQIPLINAILGLNRSCRHWVKFHQEGGIKERSSISKYEYRQAYHT